jgi:hypothetical protein
VNFTLFLFLSPVFVFRQTSPQLPFSPADKISVKEAELKILQDEAIALTSWALTWFLDKVIPEDLYANMTVLQIHEAFHATTY